MAILPNSRALLMKNFSFNGVRINYFEKNISSPNTILFIHGNSHSLNSFSEQLDAPELKDSHLVFVDLPGHGKSSRLESYSIKEIANLLAEFVKALELKNIILVGHSLGGHIAMNLAAIIKPAGLFVFGAAPLCNPFDPNVFLPNDNASALMQISPSSLEVESLMNEMNYVNEAKTLAVKEFLLADSKFRQSILADILINEHNDELEILKNFNSNLMFLVATRDRLINNKYIRTVFHEYLPKVEILEIDSGHCPQNEMSHEFNVILSNFSKNILKNDRDLNNIIKDHKHESRHYE